MNRPTLALSLLLATACLALAWPAGGEELTALFDGVAAGIFDQIDDITIEPCDPPCPGKICCDNGVCVHSVLACGFFPLQIDSFRMHGSPRSQMAGFATQGILAAEVGREARLWFGILDGEAWRDRGIEPGTYELVLEGGATPERAILTLVGRGSREVARINGHFWVFSSATSNVEVDWNLDSLGLRFLACHGGSCVEISSDLSPAG